MLRGGDTAELKAVKRVVWLAVNVAYNLRLEVSYLNDRRACLVPSLLPSFSSTSEAAIAATVNAVTSSGEAALLQQDTGDDDDDDDDDDEEAEDNNSDAEYEDSRSVGSGGAGAGPDFAAAAKAIPARFLEAAGTVRMPAPPLFSATGGDGGGAGLPAAGTGFETTPRQVREAALLRRPGSDDGDDGDGGGDDDDDDDTASVLEQPAMLSASLGVDFGESPPFLQLHKGVHGSSTAAARKFIESNRTAAATAAAGASADKARATAGGGSGGGSTATMVGTGGGGGGDRGGGGGRGFVFGSEHFAYQNQNLMITSLWMTQGTQCCNADLKFFRYYKHKHDGGRFIPYPRRLGPT